MFMDRLKGKEDTTGSYTKFAKSMGGVFDIFEKSVPKSKILLIINYIRFCLLLN